MAELADALDLGSSSSECRFDSCYPQYARQEAEAFSASFFYISLITMVEVPEIMIHYPYIRILSRYAIREKVTAGGK